MWPFSASVENIGLCMKSTQLLLMHLYLLIQFISFLKCIFLIASMLLQMYSSYFSKMFLVGFHYEPVSLDVNKVCFEEEQDTPNTRETSRKSQSVTEWCKCGKCGAMHTNVECFGALKLWDTFSYRIWDTMIGMWSPKDLAQKSCNFT